MEKKRMEESLTEQNHLLMSADLNGMGRLFGGKLLAWIDETAGIVARRHAHCDIVTAAIDNLQFKAGAYKNELIVLIGRVVYTGRTSMDIRVDTYVERQDGMRFPINRAYLTLVAIGPDDKPVEVPQLILETPAQQAEWDAAAYRRQLSRERRQQGF